MEMSVSKRLKFFIAQKGLSIRAFERSCNLSNGYVNGIETTIMPNKLSSIRLQYPELNIDWLLYGEGEMLKTSAVEDRIAVLTEHTPNSVPYFGDLPVSAGQADLMSLLSDEKPSGWISLPGMAGAIAAFPVVGCSMEPLINAGDFIAVAPLERWERVDPDKVYMVITCDDRMIKHLAVDNEDDEVLWCLSPNFRDFKIAKAEIKAIYRITFHGRIM